MNQLMSNYIMQVWKCHKLDIEENNKDIEVKSVLLQNGQEVIEYYSFLDSINHISKQTQHQYQKITQKLDEIQKDNHSLLQRMRQFDEMSKMINNVNQIIKGDFQKRLNNLNTSLDKSVDLMDGKIREFESLIKSELNDKLMTNNDENKLDIILEKNIRNEEINFQVLCEIRTQILKLQKIEEYLTEMMSLNTLYTRNTHDNLIAHLIEKK